MKRPALSRTRLISFAILLFGVVLIGRLYVVQVVEGSTFRERAAAQYQGTETASFDRGTIYFQTRDGNEVAAATLKTGYLLAIDPKLISDPEGTYEKLSTLVTLDKTNFLNKASQQNLVYVVLGDHYTDDVGTALNALKLPGVEVVPEKWRYYPAGSLASHVLGLVAYKGNDLAGRYGLESYYDSVLSRSGGTLYSNFFADIFSNATKAVLQPSELQGDLVTTIEPTVQAELEDNLKQVYDQYHATEAGGIIIDPKTGEIYAMAAFPNFDPNDFQSEPSSAVFSDPLVESSYEMGSIVKPLTMASGIDAGVVTATTTYDDKGFVMVDGSKINNYDFIGRGVIPMQQVLSQSLNTGAVFVMQQLGRDRFTDYFLNLGIGEETGIDLPNESPGIITNLYSTRDVEHATAAFGQGIAMTPIMTARALCALGNGGYLIEPHIVKRIDYTAGFSKAINPPPERQVFKTSTSKAITDMLVTVVDKALVEGKAKMDHYTIAAKTGTAQIAEPNARGYYPNEYLHSFFGYFPAYDPRFLIFLYMYKPQGVEYASQTLTAPFSALTKFLINYYNVPPDR